MMPNKTLLFFFYIKYEELNTFKNTNTTTKTLRNLFSNYPLMKNVLVSNYKTFSEHK